MAASDFRSHLRKADDPRIAGIEQLDARGWAQRMLAHPRAGPLLAGWRQTYLESEFRGVTTDGRLREGLFLPEEQAAPAAAMLQAVGHLLPLLDGDEQAQLRYPLDAREWRGWLNPEAYLHPFGLRLEEVRPAVREAILAVLQASLSAQGYQRARDLMRINHFLGELVNGPRVMNEYSYNFCLFGDPSATAPWGWSFFGHHLALNCLVAGGQLVLTPVFMGAEPNCIDAGPHAGTRVFEEEERLGLALMRALPPEQRRRAQLFAAKRDPAMPPGRVAVGDELVLAGAFQDNRVIPYEGVRAADFGAEPAALLRALLAAWLAYLPQGPLEARLREIERHRGETFFCWIGGTGNDDPFYYRLQSPVLVMEFDHHAGVFLANEAPQKFHIHTLVRTPNGNDYGMALVRRHCECLQRARAPGMPA